MLRSRLRPALVAGAVSLAALAACRDAPTAVPAAREPDPAPANAVLRPGVQHHSDGAADSAIVAIATATAAYDGGEMLATLKRERPALFAPASPTRARATSRDVYPAPEDAAPAEQKARIIYAATGGNIPAKGYTTAWVEATVDFNGNRGANVMTYAITNVKTGESIHSDTDYRSEGGSCVSAWFACVDKRHTHLISLLNVPDCDVALTANTLHEAWYWVPLSAELPNRLIYGRMGLATARSRIQNPVTRSCIIPPNTCPAGPPPPPRYDEFRAPAVPAAVTGAQTSVPITNGRPRFSCTDGGGGGTGSVGGGTIIVICITWDWYSGDGTYLGSSHGGCWYEWAE